MTKVAKAGKTAGKQVLKDENTQQIRSIINNIEALLEEAETELGAEAEGGLVRDDDNGSGPGAEGYRTETAPENENEPIDAKKDEDEDEDEENDYEMKTPDGESHIVRLKKSIAKAIIEGSPDASTGSSDAEDRVEDRPEADEENIDEITKGLLKLITRNNSKSVTRSAPVYATPEDRNSLAITKALGTIAKQVQTQGRVLEDILDGLGVAKELKAPVAQKSQKPVQTYDQSAVAKELLNSLLSAAGGQSIQRSDDKAVEQVHKNLSDATLALKSIAGGIWE